MARGPELREFCDKHGLAMISIAALAAYRRLQESIVSRRVEARLPLPEGNFAAIGYHTTVDRLEHLALVCGEISQGDDVLVSIHTECLVGDLFRSLDCDCRTELDEALAAVAREQRGVVLYLRGDEGRGTGMLANLAAHQRHERGSRKVDTGPLIEPAGCAISAQILADLGVRGVRLRTSDKATRVELERHGFHVVHDAAETPPPDSDNLRYLVRRAERGDHPARFTTREPEPPSLASKAPGG
jgi:3,4-dihydroxy 2-butanone 4-phosphate synthase/GTP cyclohydrolase II